MLRRVATEWFHTNLGWLTGGFAVLFGFIVHQPSYTFSQYAASHSVTPGGASWLFWIAALVVFVGGGVTFFYFLINAPVVYNVLNGVHYLLLRTDINNPDGFDTRRAIYSVLLYGLSAGAYLWMGNPLPSKEQANAVREYSAYLIDMYAQGGTEVGIEAFSYGFLGNPEMSFAVQVFILVIVATVLLRNYIQMNERTLFIGLNAAAVLGYFAAHFTGTQVFPMEARWIFTIQVAVSFGMMVLLAGFLNLTWWTFSRLARKGRRKSATTRPEKEEHILDALLMLVALPVFETAFGAFLVWFSVKMSLLKPWEYFTEDRSSNTNPEPMPGD